MSDGTDNDTGNSTDQGTDYLFGSLKIAPSCPPRNDSPDDCSRVSEQLGDDIDGDARSGDAGTVDLSSDGRILVVGEPFFGVDGQGRVRTFFWNCTGWIEGVTLFGESNEWYPTFGRLVALAGDGRTLVVEGSQRFFVYSLDVDGQWVQTGSLPPRTNTESVAISHDGSVIANGASETWTDAGGALIYERIGNNWTQRGDRIGSVQSSSLFGSVLAMSAIGDTLALGAPLFDSEDNKLSVGAVFVYKYNGQGWLQASDAIVGSFSEMRLGSSVAISADGSRVVAGALSNVDNGTPGSVQAYSLDDSGTWFQIGNTMNGIAEIERLGASVAVSYDGSVIAAGGPGGQVDGFAYGTTRVFRFENTTWSPVCDHAYLGENGVPATSRESSRFGGDAFGTTVALSGDGSTLAVGAPQNLGNNLPEDAEPGGHVRVFPL